MTPRHVGHTIVLATLGAVVLSDRAVAQGSKPDSLRTRPPDSMAGMPGMSESGMAMVGGSGALRMPPMPAYMQGPMLRGMEKVPPNVTAFLPGEGVDPMTLPVAIARRVITLADGDTFDLRATLVRRTLGGHTFVMYAYNGQYPGPLLRVEQNATVMVRFENQLDMPSSVHWHGVRLDTGSDGVPGMTQEAVPAGGTFLYRVHFPDAGIYWYHPHVREDIQQNLGLFGNILVASPDPAYYSPVTREEVLLLDDVLIDRAGLFPFGGEAPDFTIMGRFGNVLLVNGEPEYHLTVPRGAVVRFFLTDASNSRTYNLSFGGAPLKLVASDASRFEREEMVRSVVLAPAERYVVEALFDSSGTYALTNQVQAINHVTGEFYPEVDTLGRITVSATRAAPDYGGAFRTLRRNAAISAEIERYRPYFDRPVDHELDLTVNIQGLPIPLVTFMTTDTMYFPPVEWNDGMPDMNWVATGKETRWIMRDPATGKENMDIAWRFKRHDVVKLRLFNDPQAMHPMSHPIHFHGQRFLVLDRDGVPNENLAWKDTVLLPVGSTVDILLDASNPGTWMAHCHISEHLESGMHMTFVVDSASAGP
ncbi:MAG TPA: multicopper oxidase family protein [Gemmatimonadales bacterium]|nr:multicopper oxidase family protein [Gemmatimonadales bacterium]